MSTTSTEGVIIDTKTPKSIIENRAVGSLVGAACGDALGAPFEFLHWSEIPDEIEMSGGGLLNWERGEWTDDTSMVIPIVRIAARGDDLIDCLPELVGEWRKWLSQGPKDVGIQTRSILSSLSSDSPEEAWRESKDYFERTGRAAGNGALMRTAPVALAYLDNPKRMAEAAKLIAQLTHWEADAWEACVLWCEATRRAVLTGNFLPHAGLSLLPESSREKWDERISNAMTSSPRVFPQNGWTVHAFQAAIASINTTQTAPGAIEAAVKAGGDTDTVAAITGALAGALQGVQSLPMAWKSKVHGWPNVGYRELMTYAVLAVNSGVPHSSNGWPLSRRVNPPRKVVMYQHPQDEGIWLGNLAALDDMDLPEKVDVALALCRIGTSQTSSGIPLEEVWFVDNPAENLDLEAMLEDVAQYVLALRRGGKRVFVFCYAAESRTPAVAESITAAIQN